MGKINNYFKKKTFFIAIIVCLIFLSNDLDVFAKSTANDNSIISINLNDGKNSSSNSIQLLMLLTVIALAPSILIMLTCFTRIIIVLYFTRSALGTQQMPPNQILIGLALFLTFYVMSPVFSEIKEVAIEPYSKHEITQADAIERGMKPLREYMFKQVKTKDIELFANLAKETYNDYSDIPNRVLIPAYILTEITVGFLFGFFIYIPFIVIDMIVSSILMAMGMMMLPPAMISLPFKILIFILVDGWRLVTETLLKTFN